MAAHIRSTPTSLVSDFTQTGFLYIEAQNPSLGRLIDKFATLVHGTEERTLTILEAFRDYVNGIPSIAQALGSLAYDEKLQWFSIGFFAAKPKSTWVPSWVPKPRVPPDNSVLYLVLWSSGTQLIIHPGSHLKSWVKEEPHDEWFVLVRQTQFENDAKRVNLTFPQGGWLVMHPHLAFEIVSGLGCFYGIKSECVKFTPERAVHFKRTETVVAVTNEIRDQASIEPLIEFTLETEAMRDR